MIGQGLLHSIGFRLSRRKMSLPPLRPLRVLRSRAVPPDDDDGGFELNSTVFRNLASALHDALTLGLGIGGAGASHEQDEDPREGLQQFRTWAARCAHALSKKHILAHRVEKAGRFGVQTKRLGAGAQHEQEPIAGRYSTWFVLPAVLFVQQAEARFTDGLVYASGNSNSVPERDRV